MGANSPSNLASKTRRRVNRHSPPAVTSAESGGDARPRGGEATFAAQTALVHAWRRFPFVDPDLPEDLLPRDWPRRRAYQLFHERHDRWAAAAQAHFDSLAQ